MSVPSVVPVASPTTRSTSRKAWFRFSDSPAIEVFIIRPPENACKVWVALGKLLYLYSFQLWSRDRGSGFTKRLGFLELALPRSERAIHRRIGVFKIWPSVNGRRLPSDACTCTPGMCSGMTISAFIRTSFGKEQNVICCLFYQRHLERLRYSIVSCLNPVNTFPLSWCRHLGTTVRNRWIVATLAETCCKLKLLAWKNGIV